MVLKFFTNSLMQEYYTIGIVWYFVAKPSPVLFTLNLSNLGFASINPFSCSITELGILYSCPSTSINLYVKSSPSLFVLVTSLISTSILTSSNSAMFLVCCGS